MSTGMQAEVERLARLASDPAYVSNLAPADRDALYKVLRAAEKRRRVGKFYEVFPVEGPFRRALYPRQMEHFAAGRLYRERCMMGGNRTGKTFTGAFEMTAHLTGEYPDWWDGRVFNEPIHGWACGKQNQTLRDIIQVELFGEVVKDANNRNAIRGGGMVPSAAIRHDLATYRGGYPRLLDQVGVRYRDSRTEYSMLGLKAYEQGRGSFEGVARHVIWLDEECGIDIYGECLIRTGTVGGIVILTFTPLEGLTDTVLQFLPRELRPPEEENVDDYSEY